MSTRNWQGKRYWLVGASEGLGASLAHLMSAAGAELVLSARSETALRGVAERLPGPVEIQPMDISDDASVKAAAEKIGPIDGIVLLAGVYWPFSAKNWDAVQATMMADVNFTGFIRVLGQVVPEMVARDNGHILITSSLTAFRGLPGSIGYTASKAGTLSLAECLYADLRRTGVQVQVVNPGFIKTRLTEKNDFSMPFLMTPEAAAEVVFAHMNTHRFKRSFPSLFSLLFRGAQFLPDWLYYRVFS